MGEQLGDHLAIDLGLIRSTGVGMLGSGELAGAMDDFVDNWKIHRDKLVASVEAHPKMATDSAEAYESTDEELAKELTKHGSPSAAPPARVAS